MSRENTRAANHGAITMCRNRRYMNCQYLSPVALCDGCQFERHDLFHGTSGLSVWAWYCSMKNNIDVPASV